MPKHYATCIPTYILLKYGEIGHEFKDDAIPYGHSELSVTMNVYTHISFDDAEEELKRMEELKKTQAEVDRGKKGG